VRLVPAPAGDALPGKALEACAVTQGALDGVQLHRVDSLDVLWECARWAGERRETPLMADTESAGLNVYRDPMRLGQLGDKRHGWAFPQQWFGAFFELLGGYRGEIGFHNSPYDWRVIRRWGGLELPWNKIHDTLLLGHITDSLKLAGLKERASLEVDSRAMRGELVMKEGMKARGWTWATVPDDWEPFWMYSALDPVLTAHLWDLPSFTRTRQVHARAYDIERATARICAQRMMDVGMQIDVPYVTQKITEISEYTEAAQKWLRDEYFIENVNSNAQVSAAMNAAGIPTLVYTDKGNPSLNKESLKYYKSVFPQYSYLIDAIAWAKKGDALVHRYLNKFLAMRDADDIMRYTINTCRARTSRQSVTDPPMQTFDRDVPAVRGSFRPRPGHVFITIDADQIEARLAAHFAQDPAMIAEFRRCDELGLKFFIEMASKIYSTRISKSDPRYTWTKNSTYAQIYGSGLEKSAATAGVPVDTMRPAYMGFQQLYPQVKYLMNRLIKENKGQRPKVETIDGRWLYTFRGKEYALLNTKIQGSAATILKQGVIDLDAAGYGPYLRLTVHDEVILEVPAEHATEALAHVSDILTDRTSFAVPITWGGDILTERWEKR
jgi:DNA polymerase I